MAMMGTTMDVMMEMRFAPPKMTNAVNTMVTMPTPMAVPLVA